MWGQEERDRLVDNADLRSIHKQAVSDSGGRGAPIAMLGLGETVDEERYDRRLGERQ
jgi:hypothetical protein